MRYEQNVSNTPLLFECCPFPSRLISLQPDPSRNANFKVILTHEPPATDLPLMLGRGKCKLLATKNKCLGQHNNSFRPRPKRRGETIIITLQARRVRKCTLPRSDAGAEAPTWQFLAWKCSCQCTSALHGRTICRETK